MRQVTVRALIPAVLRREAPSSRPFSSQEWLGTYLTAEPAPGTCRGYLHVPREAFLDGQGRYGSPHNLTPVRPLLLFIGDEPAIGFRRFRFVGIKGYGWDTYLMRQVGGVWTEPRPAQR